MQAGQRPLSELRAAMAAHAKPDSQDGVQVVVLDLAGDLAGALKSNYSEFPNSCFTDEFGVGIDAL